MRYAALLRGINVGGNSLISMRELKLEFEKLGFSDVRTYINSGNVIFDSSDKAELISEKLERELSKSFKMDLRVVVISEEHLRQVLAEIPNEWKRGNDLRCYLAFVRAPITTKDVLAEVSLNGGVDSVKEGRGVLYFSTQLSGLTKSGLTKLAGKKIYKDITIRNLNTTEKILKLMDAI